MAMINAIDFQKADGEKLDKMVYDYYAGGADAVAVGRPLPWGLAVAKGRGVEQVLSFWIDELRRAMVFCGRRSTAENSLDLLST